MAVHVTDRVPLGYPLIPGGVVVVTPEVAPALAALLDRGRRQLRTDGVYQLPEPLASTIQAIEVLARMHRGLPVTAPAVVWIPTRDAAEMVGVSTEAVRKAALTGRLPYRRDGRRFLVSQAAAQVWAEDRAA